MGALVRFEIATMTDARASSSKTVHASAPPAPAPPACPLPPTAVPLVPLPLVPLPVPPVLVPPLPLSSGLVCDLPPQAARVDTRSAKASRVSWGTPFAKQEPRRLAQRVSSLKMAAERPGSAPQVAQVGPTQGGRVARAGAPCGQTKLACGHGFKSLARGGEAPDGPHRPGDRSGAEHDHRRHDLTDRADSSCDLG